MRLTEKDYCGYDIKNRKLENDYTNEEIFNALQKLGKYEDLEDTIGCPLEVYFKMCVFGTTLHTTKSGHSEVTQDFNIYIYSHVYKCFCLKILGQITPMYYAKDYGKVWAFTEEELKNE